MTTRKRIIVILFGLCVCAVVGGALSLNVTHVKGNESSAEVAAFILTANVETANLSSAVPAIQPGEEKIGTVSVANTENNAVGEVTTKYKIELTSDVELPQEVTLCLRSTQDGTEYRATQTNGNRTLFTFESDDFLFEKGIGETDSYDVFIVWEEGAVPTVLNVNVSAAVTGEQVD